MSSRGVFVFCLVSFQCLLCSPLCLFLFLFACLSLSVCRYCFLHALSSVPSLSHLSSSLLSLLTCPSSPRQCVGVLSLWYAVMYPVVFSSDFLMCWVNKTDTRAVRSRGKPRKQANEMTGHRCLTQRGASFWSCDYVGVFYCCSWKIQQMPTGVWLLRSNFSFLRSVKTVVAYTASLKHPLKGHNSHRRFLLTCKLNGNIFKDEL